jgi:hypothetical protein
MMFDTHNITATNNVNVTVLVRNQQCYKTILLATTPISFTIQAEVLNFGGEFTSKSVQRKEYNAILHTRLGLAPPRHLFPSITFVEFI